MDKGTQILKIVKIFENVPPAVMASCWTRSVLKSLNPSSTGNLPKLDSDQEKLLEKNCLEETSVLVAQPVDEDQEKEITEIDIDDNVLETPTTSSAQPESSSDSELEDILANADPTQPGASPENAPATLSPVAALSPDAASATLSLDAAPATLSSDAVPATDSAASAAAASSTGMTQEFEQKVKIQPAKNKKRPIKNQPRIDLFFKKK